MKQLVTLDLEIENNLDADDLGRRIVETTRHCDLRNDTVNIVKIYLNKNMSMPQVNDLCQSIMEAFRHNQINNAIFVPLRAGGLEEIEIKEVKVTHVTTNERTEKTTD